MARSSRARGIAPEEVVYRSESLERQTRFADDKKTTKRPTLTAAQKRKQATLTQIDFVSTPQVQSDDDEEEYEVRPKKRRRRTTAEERRRQSTLTQIDFFREVVDSEEEAYETLYIGAHDQELEHDDGRAEVEHPNVAASYDGIHEQEPPVSEQRPATQQSQATSPAKRSTGLSQARVKFESPSTPVTVRKHTIPSSQSPVESPLLTQQSTHGSRRSSCRSALRERSVNIQPVDETPSKLRFRRPAVLESGQAAPDPMAISIKREPGATQRQHGEQDQDGSDDNERYLNFEDASMEESVREDFRAAIQKTAPAQVKYELSSTQHATRPIEELDEGYLDFEDAEVARGVVDSEDGSDPDLDEDTPGLALDDLFSTSPRRDGVSSLAVQAHETQHTERSIATSRQERARAEQASTQLLQEALASRRWRDVSRTQASTVHYSPATQVPSSFPVSQTTADTAERTPRVPQAVLESPVKSSQLQWPEVVPSSPFPVPPLSSPQGWRSSAGSPSKGHFAPDSLINYTLEPPPPLSDDEDGEL